MSTKHVILGLLSIEPMTGYELTQNMKISVDSLWAATHSQIYKRPEAEIQTYTYTLLRYRRPWFNQKANGRHEGILCRPHDF